MATKTESPAVSGASGRAQRRHVTTLDRASIVDHNFIDFLDAWGDETSPRRPLPPGLTAADLLEMFESQMVSRHLDLAARWLRARNEGFYTIGSAGHEGNAVVARVTRHTDPAFLHYRSGAFMAQRASRLPDIDFVYDTILSFMASSEDPIAGGRHKVWGSVPLWVLPQTSTIASHLPKAVGTALALERARRLGLPLEVPPDSIVVCSFGDAGVNHSTAAGAFNTAQWCAAQNLPVPILFVCEDNGIGISVRTPPRWIRESFSARPGLAYYEADGCDLAVGFGVCARAVEHCRSHRLPVFLHLAVRRLLGHAGSDVETEYRTLDEIEAAERADPLIRSARRVLEAGLRTAEEIKGDYERVRARVREACERAAGRPRLGSAAEVIAPLAPLHPEAVHAEAERADYGPARERAFGGAEQLPEKGPPRHLAVNLNRALFDLMAKYPEACVFGQDVARKGGVYHVTPGLWKRFGPARVFDTLLDEQSILGMAQGCAHMGLVPIPEIQYLAYFHNACDQIRGEACSMQFFSRGQFRNPMVVRIASLAYQKGFGGHFHNDNSIAALRDIPGLIIACPARGDDAAGMLRTCAALARVDGRVVALLEPIALYMTKDLHEARDGEWQFPYPAPGEAVPFGRGRVYNESATDLLIVTYGNGVYLSLRAARTLEADTGVRPRILDLRWLNPLDVESLARHARACGRVLVVDEGRRTGGISEAVITALVESVDPVPRIRRVVGQDTYIPLGPAADLVLVSEAQIVDAAKALLDQEG
ncbi:MAG: MFS transporter [Gammaproteobacteria bacterium]|nr:MFS transporter [Gammaproteobacteria bacterium]NIR82624.1 MFS transporter [Gammaproteobacteria bacterium]NIR89087.1 MFS transporter [Gammaproteobacteria bacterium]NIU03858.1 MFS transporter [Gammaproteobacteria bacterium]NIV74234.1 MFS transporter [Gammaproteobacteria bacterium]